MVFNFRTVVAGVLLLTAASAPASNDKMMLDYGCNDLVVVGHIVKNLGYIDNNNPDDILGHVTMLAELKVLKHVSGQKSPSKLRVAYFSHAEMRDHLKMMFVLRRNGDDSYSIMSAQVMKLKPSLAEICTQD